MMSDINLLQAILDKVTSVDKKVDEVKNTRDSLTARVDNLGLQLAELSDDAPTVN